MLAFEGAATFGLRVRIQAGSTTPITIRGATKEGPFVLAAPAATTDFAVTTLDFGLPDIPIWISLTDEVGDHGMGECFVRISLMINGDPIHHLVSGYVDRVNSISWPASFSQRNSPYGSITFVAGADPAAGDEISHTVPDQQIWRLLWMRFTLVAAAAAASRRVHIVINDGSDDHLDFFSDVDQIISETKNYSVAPFSDLPDRTDDDDILIPMPPNLILPAGFVISTQTTALNAGDNFGAPIFMIERFITN